MKIVIMNSMAYFSVNESYVARKLLKACICRLNKKYFDYSFAIIIIIKAQKLFFSSIASVERITCFH